MQNTLPHVPHLVSPARSSSNSFSTSSSGSSTTSTSPTPLADLDGDEDNLGTLGPKTTFFCPTIMCLFKFHLRLNNFLQLLQGKLLALDSSSLELIVIIDWSLTTSLGPLPPQSLPQSIIPRMCLQPRFFGQKAPAKFYPMF